MEKKKTKRFYWMKLTEDFMFSKNGPLDFLMTSSPNGAKYVVLYQMLCLQTINTGGVFVTDYGDIVVIRREDDTPLIKRVIGLPGDKISIREGQVYRNGELLEEPYTRDGDTPNNGLDTAYTVPEGGIFVLGDNRRESLDSRILRDHIRMADVVGVVTFRLKPFESLRNGD